MNNGVGLPTARGSGTNGYVTRNLSYVKPSHIRNKKDYNVTIGSDKYLNNKSRLAHKPIHDDILLHKKKREIEVKLFEISIKMEEKGYTPEEIKIKIDKERKKLQDEQVNNKIVLSNKRKSINDNDINEENKKSKFTTEKDKKNKQFMEALGIDKNRKAQNDRQKKES